MGDSVKNIVDIKNFTVQELINAIVKEAKNQLK